MRATLFGDFEVEIDPRSLCSWRGGKAKHSEIIKFFYKRMQEIKAPVIEDIGAAAGSFTLLAKFHPNAFIYAYEPNPAVFRLLLENVKLNNLEMRTGTMPFALSNKDGQATLLVPRKQHRAGSATIGPHPHQKEWKKVAVETRRLDRFSRPEGLDLVKLDVEGAELLVLKGGRHTIKKHKPGILLEWFEPNMRRFGYGPDKVEKLLRSWGYKKFVPLPPYDMWATA